MSGQRDSKRWIGDVFVVVHPGECAVLVIKPRCMGAISHKDLRRVRRDVGLADNAPARLIRSRFYEFVHFENAHIRGEP